MNWQDYTPKTTTRQKEQTEWSITYSYQATEEDKGRVLLIGDSICNGYQNRVRELLEGEIYLSFWASSKCVTDKDYFRELDFMMDAYSYDVICFNNGLHSLSTNRQEWDAAYEAVVNFIQAKSPDARLLLTLSTPLADPALTKISASLNETVLAVALAKSLPVIDLFTPMDALDRGQFWSDTYHFRQPAIDIQAGIIADCIRTAWK